MRLFTLSIIGLLSLLPGVPAAAQTLQYVQAFDAVVAPDLPPGWSSPEDAWTTSTSVASPGSGGNNIENKGNTPGSLVSPVFDFSAASSGLLRYAARRTSTYDSLNLQIEASIDGGATWTVIILDSTASLQAAPSTYTTVTGSLPASMLGKSSVRFRFRSLHSTGGNVRVDDIELFAEGVVSLSRFGFAEAGSTSIENNPAHPVPIRLELIPSAGSLQGLQFTLGLSPGVSFVSIEPGIVEFASPEWHISHEVDGSLVRIVALAEGTIGLPPVTTDSLFVVTVTTDPLAGSPSRVDSLKIDEVVASSASETGQDLFVAVESQLHLITVLPRAPRLGIDSARIDFGTIALDSTALAVVTLTNTGTDALEVIDMYSISGLLGIDPAFLSLDPGASSPITVSIQAALYGVGAVEDWLVIEHDAPSSPDTVAVVGTVISVDARGDANGDGSVDLVDLVLGIDFILGRPGGPEDESVLDLHPFPEGNESIDVRDLTVLAQAIARGQWPDGAAIPTSEAQIGKTAGVVGDLLIRRMAEQTEVWVRSAEPLRAIHVIAQTDQSILTIAQNSALPAIQVGMPYSALGQGSFGLLTFGMESLPVSAGESVLLATIDLPQARELEVRSAVAVDRAVEKRLLVPVVETAEEPNGSAGTVFGPPYPNPVDPGRAAFVHLPLTVAESGQVTIMVTDVLGRHVRRLIYNLEPGERVAAWDLRNAHGLAAPPGLYFVTVAFGERRLTQTVVVR